MNTTAAAASPTTTVACLSLLPVARLHTKEMADGLTHAKIEYVKKLVADMEKH